MNESIGKMIKALGRPPKFATPEDMQEAVIDYFENYATDTVVVGEGKEAEKIGIFKPTITGLAYHIGMTTETLRCYEGKGEFSATVKRAKQLVEMAVETRLDSKAVTGAIFILKTNFRWNDGKQEEVSADMATAMLELAKRLPQ